MGELRKSSPQAILLFAAFSQFEELLDETPALLADRFGPVELIGPRFEFVETNYYADTMGDRLFKQLIVLKGLIDPARLPAIKLEANQIEDKLRASGRFAVERPYNLDPGYMDAAKFVLASTKDHMHRLYLGSGIYGEITTYYQAKDWRAWPWTYPDYKRDDVRAFLKQARDYFRRLTPVA